MPRHANKLLSAHSQRQRRQRLGPAPPSITFRFVLAALGPRDCGARHVHVADLARGFELGVRVHSDTVRWLDADTRPPQTRPHPSDDSDSCNDEVPSPQKKQRSESLSSTASVPTHQRLASPDHEIDFVTIIPAAPSSSSIAYLAPAMKAFPLQHQNTKDDSDSDNDCLPSLPSSSVSTTKKVTATVAPRKQSPCHFCESTKTGQWRRGPNGMKTLCNACGITWGRKVRNYAREHDVPVEVAEQVIGAEGAGSRRFSS
ncbi:hypothetical protein BC830DRAFT_1156008 [Chytriomyces sp. MP71]|nr:hypothetical protein BC830DRAFT_1158775 [Chytriomyces sp. MP71]KAI8608247.1 hypothetical protein BC830DRAFT_1156008 [Chytriomyces sp. MP71]